VQVRSRAELANIQKHRQPVLWTPMFIINIIILVAVAVYASYSLYEIIQAGIIEVFDPFKVRMMWHSARNALAVGMWTNQTCHGAARATVLPIGLNLLDLSYQSA